MSLYVKNNEKGRGLYTKELIKSGKIFIFAPVIILNKSDTKTVRKTLLDNYVFDWPSEDENEKSPEWTASAICLDYGSLINHSDNPNSYWLIYPTCNSIGFFAKRDIAPNEEITFNYHWDKIKKKKVGIL